MGPDKEPAKPAGTIRINNRGIPEDTVRVLQLEAEVSSSSAAYRRGGYSRAHV